MNDIQEITDSLKKKNLWKAQMLKPKPILHIIWSTPPAFAITANSSLWLQKQQPTPGLQLNSFLTSQLHAVTVHSLMAKLTFPTIMIIIIWSINNGNNPIFRDD